MRGQGCERACSVARRHALYLLLLPLWVPIQSQPLVPNDPWNLEEAPQRSLTCLHPMQNEHCGHWNGDAMCLTEMPSL